MGVVGSVYRVDGDKLRTLTEQPSELRWYLTGAAPEPRRVSWLGRLLGKQPDPPPPTRPPWQPPPEEDSQYLDKAWHAIHYLLSGSAQPGDGPLSLLMSGRSLELDDFAVLIHDANATRDIAAALKQVDREWLLKRWNPVMMANDEVYLMQDCESDDPELRDYVLDYATELVEFVRSAAATGCGLVVDVAG